VVDEVIIRLEDCTTKDYKTKDYKTKDYKTKDKTGVFK